MKKVQMAVYRKSHPNGQPWKVWCVRAEGQDTVVRFGGEGKTLQERVLDPSGDTPNQAAQKKLGEGYVYAGEYMVGDRVETAVNPAPIQPTPAPVDNKPKVPKELLFWAGTNRVIPDWSTRAVEKLSPVIDCEARKTDGGEELHITSIGFIHGFQIEITNSGETRGVIEYGGNDLQMALALIVAARESQAIRLTDADMNNVSLSRFRPGDKHLNFWSGTYDYFMQKAQQVGLVRSNAEMKISGATPFF